MVESTLDKAKRISTLILDVDGVLTDGGIIIDERGKETKRFDVRDGHGIKMLMRAGVEVILLTGRQSMVVEHRAVDLGIKEVYQGVWNKLEVFLEILKRKAITPEEIAFVGDDFVDIPVLRRVGLAVAVSDAIEEVRQVAHYVTKNQGGRGAVREVCELILKAKGKWEEIMNRYELP